jgi:hypothetical protein
MTSHIAKLPPKLAGMAMPGMAPDAFIRMKQNHAAIAIAASVAAAGPSSGAIFHASRKFRVPAACLVLDFT